MPLLCAPLTFDFEHYKMGTETRKVRKYLVFVCLHLEWECNWCNTTRVVGKWCQPQSRCTLVYFSYLPRGWDHLLGGREERRQRKEEPEHNWHSIVLLFVFFSFRSPPLGENNRPARVERRTYWQRITMMMMKIFIEYQCIGSPHCSSCQSSLRESKYHHHVSHRVRENENWVGEALPLFPNFFDLQFEI